MKAFVNHTLISRTSVDSGSITPHGMVIHQLREPGEYQGTLLLGDAPAAGFTISVEREVEAQQVDIDLFALHHGAAGTHEGASRFTVRPEGYAVFYVSQGRGGYAVVMRRQGEERRRESAFDSRRLSEGDLFAVTLLRPGTYSVRNTEGRGQARIVVAYPERGNAPYTPPDAVQVRCSREGFKPRQIEVRSAQGQVYSFDTPSRLQFELQEPEDLESPEERGPVAQWRKRRQPQPPG